MKLHFFLILEHCVKWEISRNFCCYTKNKNKININFIEKKEVRYYYLDDLEDDRPLRLRFGLRLRDLDEDFDDDRDEPDE